jgi:hypothetical protein
VYTAAKRSKIGIEARAGIEWATIDNGPSLAQQGESPSRAQEIREGIYDASTVDPLNLNGKVASLRASQDRKAALIPPID